MSLELNITLSTQTYERLKLYARAQNQNVAEAVADYLEENPPTLSPTAETKSLRALRREKEAFLALYPALRDEYKGQFVAIYQGQLIDHDVNYSHLYERLHTLYPNQIMWISQIQESALPDIVMRSPRLEPLA